MKLLRFDDGGRPTLGVLHGDQAVSLAPLAGRYSTMLSLIAGGGQALDAVRATLDAGGSGTPVAGLRLLAPVERPGKFPAIG